MANAMLDAWQEDGAYRRVELSRCGSESDGRPRAALFRT
jgi:hypothetical protein